MTILSFLVSLISLFGQSTSSAPISSPAQPLAIQQICITNKIQVEAGLLEACILGGALRHSIILNPQHMHISMVFELSDGFTLKELCW